MYQLLSNLKTGDVTLVEVPLPHVAPGEVLIRTHCTLVSSGTEKMLVEFGRASLIRKLYSQPERFRQLLDKVKTDGLIHTVEGVCRRLDEPVPLGYANAGTVVGLGTGVTAVSIGERVVSNGPHAEYVSIPVNLVAKIPDPVSDDSAVFTVVASVGLQGIRLAKPELGETFVVVGMGLIGQLTAQLLRASGCRVIGFDPDIHKLEIAQKMGISLVGSPITDDVVQFVHHHTAGLGADGVIITATARSNDVIADSARMSRKRGRVILVGVVGLHLNRKDFYEKELTFQVSCSYGPGRYDEIYEVKSFDYPPAFVRWTENRNFQAVLEALRSGVLNVEPLITQRLKLRDFRKVYGNLDAPGLASIFIFGETNGVSTDAMNIPILARRPLENDSSKVGDRCMIRLTQREFAVSEFPLAVIGAGNFVKMVVLPALKSATVPIKYVVCNSGISGTALAKKYAVPWSTTSSEEVLADPQVKGVVIATRHYLHASQVLAAVVNGKHVLVEKPLCLSLEELGEIGSALGNSSGVTVTVGYNRRFSPHAKEMKRLLAGGGPMSIIATMNAGEISPTHWVHDPEVGGGRLVGEACHLIDFAIFLCGSLITAVSAVKLDVSNDSASILLKHDDGSTSAVNYLANGNKGVSKERIEVHSRGRTLLLDNFRDLRAYGFRRFSRLKMAQDKGHKQQFAMFAEAIKHGGPALIPWREIENGTKATLAIPRAITERCWIQLS